ncbi:MAG TPA: sialidase family protein, partial [Actinomycetota bacterium]|nr:sialidase family protein [Actinomycetota bacterium]
RLFVPKGHCDFPWIAISEDAGDSWTRVQVSDIPAAGTHLSVASDTAGNLYFVWWAQETRLPFLSVSRDSGKTWGKPMMIAPPGVTEANFPVITAGDPGKIAINFPSSTDEDRQGPERPWNQHVVVSTNALSRNPVFLSATANDPDDPVHRGACNGRCAGMWDFLDIVIGPTGELWATASDDCVGMCISGLAYSLKNGEGIAIRQIGGPRLLKEMRWPRPPSGLPDEYVTYGSTSIRPLRTR